MLTISPFLVIDDNQTNIRDIRGFGVYVMSKSKAYTRKDKHMTPLTQYIEIREHDQANISSQHWIKHM